MGPGWYGGEVGLGKCESTIVALIARSEKQNCRKGRNDLNIGRKWDVPFQLIE